MNAKKKLVNYSDSDSELTHIEKVKKKVKIDEQSLFFQQQVLKRLEELIFLLKNHQSCSESSHLQNFLQKFPKLTSLKDLRLYEKLDELFLRVFQKTIVEKLKILIDQEFNELLISNYISSLEYCFDILLKIKDSIHPGLKTLCFHYCLHILNYPQEKAERIKIFLSKILKGEIICIGTDNKNGIYGILLEEIKKTVEKSLIKTNILEGYRIIDNFFIKEGELTMNLEQTANHVQNLIDFLFSQKKIYFISSFSLNDDIGETLFDGSIYFPLSDYQNYKDAIEENYIETAANIVEELSDTFLHELAHLKRIKCSALNYFFKPTPEKYEESGNWLESNYPSSFFHNGGNKDYENKKKKIKKCGTTHPPPGHWNKYKYSEE